MLENSLSFFFVINGKLKRRGGVVGGRRLCLCVYVYVWLWKEMDWNYSFFLRVVNLNFRE